MVKICLPIQEMKEACVRSLGLEDPLEKEMSTHSSSSVGKESDYNTGDSRQCRRPGISSLEKEMTTHSNILVWEIPWIEEHGRLQSMGLQELDMT